MGAKEGEENKKKLPSQKSEWESAIRLSHRKNSRFLLIPIDICELFGFGIGSAEATILSILINAVRMRVRYERDLARCEEHPVGASLVGSGRDERCEFTASFSGLSKYTSIERRKIASVFETLENKGVIEFSEIAKKGVKQVSRFHFTRKFLTVVKWYDRCIKLKGKGKDMSKETDNIKERLARKMGENIFKPFADKDRTTMFDDAKKEKKFNQVKCVDFFIKAMRVFVDTNFDLTHDCVTKGKNVVRKMLDGKDGIPPIPPDEIIDAIEYLAKCTDRHGIKMQFLTPSFVFSGTMKARVLKESREWKKKLNIAKEIMAEEEKEEPVKKRKFKTWEA